MESDIIKLHSDGAARSLNGSVGDSSVFNRGLSRTRTNSHPRLVRVRSHLNGQRDPLWTCPVWLFFPIVGLLFALLLPFFLLGAEVGHIRVKILVSVLSVLFLGFLIEWIICFLLGRKRFDRTNKQRDIGSAGGFTCCGTAYELGTFLRSIPVHGKRRRFFCVTHPRTDGLSKAFLILLLVAGPILKDFVPLSALAVAFLLLLALPALVGLFQPIAYCITNRTLEILHYYPFWIRIRSRKAVDLSEAAITCRFDDAVVHIWQRDSCNAPLTLHLEGLMRPHEFAASLYRSE